MALCLRVRAGRPQGIAAARRYGAQGAAQSDFFKRKEVQLRSTPMAVTGSASASGNSSCSVSGVRLLRGWKLPYKAKKLPALANSRGCRTREIWRMVQSSSVRRLVGTGICILHLFFFLFCCLREGHPHSRKEESNVGAECGREQATVNQNYCCLDTALWARNVGGSRPL
jgi:hypothetical protein